MRSNDGIRIRDPRAAAGIVSGWTLRDRAHQRAAADSALAAMPGVDGLVRFSVFGGVDDHTLVLYSQWEDHPRLAAYLADTSGPRAAVDDTVPDIRRDWREVVSPYRSFVLASRVDARALVVVRQPFAPGGSSLQRAWVDLVVEALEADDSVTRGLVAATFLLSADGAQVLNLAEWTSADAHRAAMASPGGAGDAGRRWQAVQEFLTPHPDSDVRRYELIGASEPAGGSGTGRSGRGRHS